jgi:hypothetical protein
LVTEKASVPMTRTHFLVFALEPYDIILQERILCYLFGVRALNLYVIMLIMGYAIISTFVANTARCTAAFATYYSSVCEEAILKLS